MPLAMQWQALVGRVPGPEEGAGQVEEQAVQEESGLLQHLGRSNNPSTPVDGADMAQLTCKQHVVVSVQQARVAHHQDRERLPSKYIAMDLGKNLWDGLLATTCSTI